MDEATRSAWSREQGLYPAELDSWKQDAIAGLGEPPAASAVEARQDRRRIKELERELHRKDKALAETAALLVVAKKLTAAPCGTWLRIANREPYPSSAPAEGGIRSPLFASVYWTHVGQKLGPDARNVLNLLVPRTGFEPVLQP